MDSKTIKETLRMADEIKPLAEFNGIKIGTFEDCVVLTHADAIIGGDELGISGRIMDNATGLPARSKTKYAAVNPAKMFANRARYIKDEDGNEKLQIVIDYRAISEQDTGKVYLKNIPMYQIAREGKELVVEKVSSIEDTIFMSEFNEILNLDSMLEILPVIDAHGEDKTAGEIRI